MLDFFPADAQLFMLAVFTSCLFLGHFIFDCVRVRLLTNEPVSLAAINTYAIRWGGMFLHTSSGSAWWCWDLNSQLYHHNHWTSTSLTQDSSIINQDVGIVYQNSGCRDLSSGLSNQRFDALTTDLPLIYHSSTTDLPLIYYCPIW